MRIDLEQWRELASPIYDVHPHEMAAEAEINVDVSEASGLFITKVELPPEMLVHDPTRKKDACHDYLLFERFYAGSGQCEVADIDFEVSPSRLHLIDMSQKYVSMKGPTRSRGICIPHAALGYARGEEPVFSSIELNSPQGRLLAAAHAELVTAQDAGVGNDDIEVLAQAFVGLVRQFMLGPGVRADSPLATEMPLRLLLRDFVAANLHRPDLDVDMLTAAFGLSRATVYRHFEEEGGIARTIRNRRLDRCFFELAGGDEKRGQIAAVARRWHFTDATHFNRIFRERFGMAPSECLASGTRPGAAAPPDQARIVHDWLERFKRV